MAKPYDAQFQAMNIGLHRQNASRFGAPALVWHRYFWKPTNLKISDWQKHIGNILCRAFLGAKNLKLTFPAFAKLHCPNFDGNNLYVFHRLWNLGEIDTIGSIEALRRSTLDSKDIEDAHQSAMQNTFACDIEMLGIKFSLRATLQSEFWSIRIIVDCSADPEKYSYEKSRINKLLENAENRSDARIYLHKFEQLRDLFSLLTSLTDDIVSIYNCDPSEDSTGRSPRYDLQKLLKKRTNNISREITDDFRIFCEESFNKFIEKRDDDIDFSAIFDETVFGEFVGVILGLAPSADNTQKLKSGHNIRMGLSRTIYPENHVPIPDRNRKLARYTEDDALYLIDSMWPMLKNLHKEFSESNFDDDHEDIEAQEDQKSEYTASLFQRNHFIYISSLGRVIYRKSIDHYQRPITYIGICGHTNRWQLGRIVDKIHDLGALRLSAVRDFRAVLNAGRELNRLQISLVNDDLDVTDIRNKLNAVERMDFEFSDEAISEDRHVEGSDPSADIVGGGLYNRLERSRYYISRFREIYRSLEIKRIEGFQPYDRFVERRLSDKFSTIEYVSNIYEQTISHYRSVLDASIQTEIQRQTKDLRSHAKKSSDLLDAIQDHTDKSRAFLDGIQVQTEVVRYQAERSSEILKIGEALSFAPLTYYVGKMLADVAVIFPGPEWMQHEAWAFLPSASLVFLAIRYFNKRYDKARMSAQYHEFVHPNSAALTEVTKTQIPDNSTPSKIGV